MANIESRLKECGIVLPDAPAPQANYLPYVISGNLVHVSGQIPMDGHGRMMTGRVGADLGIEDGCRAARLCTLNIVAQVRRACDGDLDRVRRVVRIGGFINAVSDFDQHPALLNAASDLLVEIFGEAGRHARFAVGAGSLPLNVPIEIDAVFELS